MPSLSKTAIAVLAAIACLGAARAQDFPTHPIRVIVGPGPDIVPRLLGPKMSDILGQPVVVEPRTGAGGVIAAQAVAAAPPDGHTLLQATASYTINTALQTSPLDLGRDFAPILLATTSPFVLLVHPSVPAKTLGELIAYAKANPGKLSFASGNTSGIVAGETLKRWAGIDLLHVPYKSTPPALEDIIAGRVSMMFADLTTAMPHVNAGALRALAVTRIKRSAVYPELPTLDEEGVTGFDLDAWAGIVAPARTPAEIVDRLNKELRVIIDDPAIRGRLKTVGFEAFSSSPGELGDFVKVQLGKWEKMVKESGVKPR